MLYVTVFCNLTIVVCVQSKFLGCHLVLSLVSWSLTLSRHPAASARPRPKKNEGDFSSYQLCIYNLGQGGSEFLARGNVNEAAPARPQESQAPHDSRILVNIICIVKTYWFFCSILYGISCHSSPGFKLAGCVDVPIPCQQRPEVLGPGELQPHLVFLQQHRLLCGQCSVPAQLLQISS